MITTFKIFETWNDDSIDKSLFVSGRAKHNPKVVGNTIEYETDNGKFIAKIKKIGSKFICKIYKIREDGSKIRIRKKTKKTLKTAHNFVREVLNDRIKEKKKKKKKKKEEIIDEPLDNLFVDNPPVDDESMDLAEPFDFSEPEPIRKTIIRRFR